MKFGKAVQWDVTVTATQNQGFIMNIGCQVRAYESPDSLMSDLREYFLEHERVVNEYNRTVPATCTSPERPTAEAEERRYQGEVVKTSEIRRPR